MKKEKILCGWGRSDVTPTGNTFLRGQMHQRISEGVHDPLYVTALAIGKSPEEAVIWLSIDIVQLPENLVFSIAEKIAETIPGFTRDRLICSAIHTHTAPFAENDSEIKKELWGPAFRLLPIPEGVESPDHWRNTTLVPGAAKAAVEAWQTMQPSGVSPILGFAVIGHCRRVVYRDGTSKMYGTTNTYNFERLEAPADNSVEMIYVYNEAKELTGLILNVCCPAQVVENKMVISADYVGAFRQQLEEKLGKPLPVLTIIGAAGDISPRDLIRQRPSKDPIDAPERRPDNRGEPSMRDFEGAWELGRRLVNCFEYDREKADANIQYEVEYEHTFEYLPTLIRTVSEADFQQAKKDLQELLDRNGGDYAAFSQADKNASSLPNAIINRYKRQKKSTLYDTPVHIMRLGDCALVTCPYELYLEYGLRIRARSNAVHTLIAEITDDENEYLPTPFAVKAKSYSALVCNQLVSCEGGETYVEHCIRAINKMFEN